MALIPKEIYALVERKRRSRYAGSSRALFRLQEAQAAAYSLPSPGAGKAPGKSGPGDRVGRLALAVVEAEEQLRKEQAWESVWQMMDRIFPFEHTMEGMVAGYLYDNGMTQKEAGAACHCSREAVCRARDNWVCHAALIAASDGLVDIREGTT